jgi:hypothetical protein
MKKIKVFLSLVLCLVLLSACGGGRVQAKPVIGTSELYTDAEIQDAMKIVLGYFKKEFDGCTLTRLEYDEPEVRDEMMGWASQYDAGQAIVLLSDFEVDASGGDGSLNPDSTYRNWKWILTRTGNGKWVLQTWGYG